MSHRFSKKWKHCPLCGKKDIIPHKLISSGQYSFKTDLCPSCGFIFMNPPFDEMTIKSFYSDEYYSGKAEYSYTDERAIYDYSSHVWDARIRNIHAFVKTGNFLDVGCSFGGFLSRAKKYYTPYGVEISEYSSSYARKHFGITVHNGTIETSDFNAGMFSVITMIEMIEHLANPVSAIRKCSELLNENGVLVIQTADMDGWQSIKDGAHYHYYLPGHLSYFSEKSLIYALKTNGFSRFRIYRPVDFGLLPKLLKSRGTFKSLSDYFKWFKIASYHFKGFFPFKGRPLTSSMVIYAFK
jgi:SAM-dependent methyltransferase